MKYKSLKILIAILLLAFSASLLFTAACFLIDSGNGSGDNDALIKTSYKGYGQGGVFISPENFEQVKDDWYGKDSGYLLSDKANAAICSELVEGRTYYYVYTLNLQYSSLPGNSGKVHFGISTPQTALEHKDAFTFGEKCIVDSKSTAVSVELGIPGQSTLWMVDNACYFYLSANKNSDVKTYVAIEVTPLITGAAFAQFNWEQYNEITKKYYEQPAEHIACATVKSAEETEATDDGKNSLTVTKINTFTVSEEDYPDGNIPDECDGYFRSSLEIGKNYYLVTDIEVKNSGGAETFGVAVFSAESSVVYANLHQSNSSSFSSASFASGKIINVGYTAPYGVNAKKSVRIIVNLSPLSDSKCPLYIVVYSAESAVSGKNCLSYSLSCSVSNFADNSSALTYEFYDPHYSVTGRADKSVTEIVIPDTYNGLPVTSVKKGAFYLNGGSSLTKVTIGNSVTSIGVNAFRGNKIDEIIFGENVKSIGEGAFYDNEIKSLALPQSVNYIGKDAFKFNGITELILPSFLETIR